MSWDEASRRPANFETVRHAWDRDAERAIYNFWLSRRRWPTVEENRTLPDPRDYARHCDYLSALETWARTTAYVDHTLGAGAPPIDE